MSEAVTSSPFVGFAGQYHSRRVFLGDLDDDDALA
jgi:hypothetical protein